MSGVQIPFSLLTQMLLDILLYIFTGILLLSSVMVISVQNPVYSVLFLILSFVSSICVLLLLECEFFSLMFLIIYVGAIAVLFLFVVMMLDVKYITISKKDTIKYLPFGIIVLGLVLLEILMLIKNSFTFNSYINIELKNFYVNWLDQTDAFNEIEAVGQIMYTQYVVQFLIAGNILLLATIAAVVLTVNTDNKTQLTKQIIFKQLSRTNKNSIIVK